LRGPAIGGRRPSLAEFRYHLPDDLIAQRPAERRRGSRLLHLGRREGEVEHLAFTDLPRLLGAGDLIVVNDTRVFRARLFARRGTAGDQEGRGGGPRRGPGGGKVELFLLEYPRPDGSAPCLLRPAARVKNGEELTLAEGTRVTVRREDAGGGWSAEAPPGALARAAEAVGRVPLPPYIKRGERDDPADSDRYQTVYADKPGAVAAPTAGLHFDREMLAALGASGVETAAVTLHVGAGTFAPVRVPDLSLHRMHEEAYEVPHGTADAVARAKGEGRRVVAVGTTVVRALESAALAADPGAKALAKAGALQSGPGRTSLFILPGFRFRVVDALLTNFHLPESTLLMLVSAFAGRERVLAAYAEAVRERYRFFSYGDCMFIGDCPRFTNDAPGSSGPAKGPRR